MMDEEKGLCSQLEDSNGRHIAGAPRPMVAATLTSLHVNVDVTVALRGCHTGEKILGAKSHSCQCQPASPQGDSSFTTNSKNPS